MTYDNQEPELLLGASGVYRRVPLASIAAVFHLTPALVRESLSRLFFAISGHATESVEIVEGEKREGESGTVGSENGSLPTGHPEKRNVLGSETLDPGPVRSNGSDASAYGAPKERPILLTGTMLATALDDTGSLSFYDQLVRSAAPAVVAQALDETLRHRSLIRGRPGAYFTALVRRLSSTPPYARTTSATP